MPTYEYACRSCGSQLDVVQSFTDDPLTTCGSCGGSLRKVFGAVGISFKGSGFYKTDSRKSSGPSSSGAAAAESGTSEPSTKETPAKETAAKETAASSATASPSGDGGASKKASAPPAPASAP